MKYLTFFLPNTLNTEEVPPFIFYKKGAVLFSDVSGFTPMSEKLSTLGVKGAEILTEILNNYFTKMIKIIKENGGEVMKFGGDAIHCFFPFEESLPYAIKASFEMQEEMKNYKKIKTPVGHFSLNMKIGLAFGDVLIGCFGDINKRLEYIFAGEPVDRSAEAEHYAKAGDVVLCYEGKDINIENEKLDENFYKLISFKSKSKPLKLKKQEKTINPYSKAYLLPEVYEAVSKGYTKHLNALLDVLTIFFQFSGFSYRKDEFDEKKFQEFFLKINEIIENYNGRINRISMGDKGSVMLFLFGAPNQLEKKEEVGCQFALEQKENLEKNFPEINFKIGMNSGKAFAGIVGGSGRLEYTIIGDSVNFSARLMQSSEEREIIVSDNVFEKAKDLFEFKYIGEKYFKGKTEAQKIYLLEGRKKEEFELKEIIIFGREKEIEEIKEYQEEAKDRKPSVIFLEGEGGIGKSHLAKFIIKDAIKGGWKVFQSKGEITLKNHIYAPFKELFKKLLFEEEINIKEIEKILKDTDGSFLEYLPIHLEFFGFETKKFEIEEETKKRLLHHQLSTILLKKIRNKKTIIFLDNFHWFDTLSKELFLSILHHLKDEKLLILICTREREEKFKDLPLCNFIKMKEMEKGVLKGILEEEYKEKIRDELVEFIKEKTKGNPFFSINFFKYLKDNGLIEKHLGEWLLKRGIEEKKEFTFNDIISAQIADLSIEEKVLLRLSACIGPTFKKNILRNVLKKNFKEDLLSNLINKGFLTKIDEETFSFNQTLMQETIYQEIPEKLRRKNHRIIGREMEKIFKGKSQYFPNLASHFYLGGIKDKAANYSLKAGDFLFEKYAYPEAKIFYERAFNIYKKYSRDIKLEAGNKYSKTLLRIGQPKEALNILDKILKNKKAEKQKKGTIEAKIAKYECYKRLGKYNYLEKAKKLLADINEKKLSNHLKCLIAECYMRKGDFYNSSNLFKEILKHKKSLFKEDITSSYTFLLLIYTIQKKFEKALKYYNKGISFCKENKDLYQIIRIKIAYVSLLLSKNENIKAINEIKSLVPLAESLGDIYYLSSVYFNISKTLIDQGEFSLAKNYLDESLKLNIKIGTKEGMAYCYNYKGILNYYQGHYEEAYNEYYKAYKLFRLCHENKEIKDVIYNLAEVTQLLNRKKEALKWYYEGISLLKENDNPNLFKMFQELRQKINKM